MEIWKSFKKFVGIMLLLTGLIYPIFITIFIILLILNETVLVTIEKKIESKE